MKHLGFLVTTLVVVAACGDGDSDSTDAASLDAAPPDAPAADASPDASPDAATPTFSRHTIDGTATGPAYAAVGDLDGNGRVEVVVSHFGVMAGPVIPDGEVAMYTRGADLATWTKTSIVPPSAHLKYPGQPTLADVDGDLDLDVFVPSGFLVCQAVPGGQPCGGLGWYEQTAAGWIRRDVVPLGDTMFYHHVTLVDLDGDGVKDLLTTGEAAGGPGGGSASTRWFKGITTGVRFETTARVIGAGGGSYPRAVDVDRDGDLDVASAQFFVAPSFVWFERTGAPSSAAPAGTWTRHTVNGDMGAAIMMTAVDDLYGDGVRRYVGANHTNTASVTTDPESAIAVFTPGADPRQPWTKTKISSTIVSRANMGFARMGAPGIFGVGDMDGDRDADLVVSGDGDENVYFLEQTAPGQFASHVLQAGLGQAGGVTIADLDGDGDRETVVTGYEDNIVYVFTH